VEYTRNKLIVIVFGVPFIVGGGIIGLLWYLGLFENSWCALGVLFLSVAIWGAMTSVLARYFTSKITRQMTTPVILEEESDEPPPEEP
jgi:hypothetical protein